MKGHLFFANVGGSPEEVKKSEAALKTAGKTKITFHQFNGVGHAFASKSAAKTGAYNEETPPTPSPNSTPGSTPNSNDRKFVFREC